MRRRPGYRPTPKPTPKTPAPTPPPTPAPWALTDPYRETVRSQSYIGKKGYTLPKAVLAPPDLQALYQELYMVPAQHGPVAAHDPSASFPVYRENTNKIYVPRFYGIERYGLPALGKDIDLSKVTPIDCPFEKPLRDYQEEIVQTYLNHLGLPAPPAEHSATLSAPPNIPTPHEKLSNPYSSGGIIQIGCGAGKTVMAIKILATVAKKTLIIVHKEFLLNQWIERLRDFLPTARIGRIQGPTFDTQDKDVVMGMLQTLYDRDFPDGAFDDFGLTIIDEVHRIGSSQFSRALLKIQTPHMLGVTATLERKDGLTKVLHMFIGPLVYSKPANTTPNREQPVTVRGMTFVSRDPVFNTTETDFRGNPAFSTMLSKLCDHGPRTRFILQVLQDLVIENPDAQMLILGHHRSLLSQLYADIECMGFAEPGMYVGGMKQHLLDQSSQRQIVIATYSMAAEALDIPNLSILVMVTPKTDIVQSVGRIFRAQHAKKVIVDITDTHDLFQNQWNKRRIYYKKSGYKIMTTQSTKYQSGDFEEPCPHPETWTTVYDPFATKARKAAGAPPEPDDPELPYGGKCMIQLDPADL